MYKKCWQTILIWMALTTQQKSSWHDKASPNEECPPFNTNAILEIYIVLPSPYVYIILYSNASRQYRQRLFTIVSRELLDNTVISSMGLKRNQSVEFVQSDSHEKRLKKSWRSPPPYFSIFSIFSTCLGEVDSFSKPQKRP
jgi:hypothetical protein